MDAPNSLAKKLSQWLDKGGYPFEMKVARAFRQSGFGVAQSEYYTDPDANLSREIDVAALIQRNTQKAILRVQFVIECKTSLDKPWVVFASPGHGLQPPGRVAQRAASKIGERLLFRMAQRKDTQALDLFQFEDTVGYGISQAFANSSDSAYAALMGVAKAAKAQAVHAELYSTLATPLVSFEFPVVALDGRMFRCILEQNGEISVTEISSATLLWRNPVLGMPNSVIHLLTAASVDSYADKWARSSAVFLEQCIVEIEQSWPALESDG